MITALLLVSRILESIPPNVYTELDSDLKRGGGGGGGGSAGPLGGGGGRSPSPNFSALSAAVWSKKKGGAWAASATYIFSRLFSKHFFKKLVERI